MVAVVAVAAVLLLVFLVVPLLPGSGSTTSAAAVLTYSGARPVANQAVSGFDGGGWTLLVAAGIVTATSEPIPVNETALGNSTTCTYTPVASLSDLTIPGFTGNRSAGVSPAWEFIYRNSSEALAVVSVLNGHGFVLATLTGADCAIFAELFTPIPGDVIDSSQAAADVEPLAAAFLSANPNASAEFGLIGGTVALFGHGLGPEWSIMYSTCALSPSATGTGSEFNATVNALTGKVLGANTTTGVSCNSSSTTEAVATGPTMVGTPSTALAPEARPTRLA